jgi:glycosyltransferase involved in cell wall biosynthesis
MKVFACHLLNDYSGSPKVLMQLVKAWTKNDIDVTVITCSGRNGFLSGIDKANYSYYWYKWSANSIIRLINFVLSQVLLFFKLLWIAKKEDTIYVNTVLPFGAAIAGKLKGCKVIYHIHETTVKPKVLKTFLFVVIKLCANDVVYVSNYLSKQEPITTAKNHILYNAIENVFFNQAINSPEKERSYKNVLMISSLKTYKGVFEFIELANLNPTFNFKLVVNASQKEIDTCFFNTQIPVNTLIYPTQTNTHYFYQWADVVLNLSHTDGWIETFGLTILEAMAYSLPTIIPPVGGITELTEEGVSGYLVDSKDINKLSIKLNQVLNNKDIYKQMQKNAFSKMNKFREDNFINNSLFILNVLPH